MIYDIFKEAIGPVLRYFLCSSLKKLRKATISFGKDRR
jgi:hypothetical protein